MLPTGAAGQAAVAGGAAQFALSSLIGVIAAHEKGIPFTLIAPAGVVTSDVPYSQFVVKADSPIKTRQATSTARRSARPGLKDMDTVAIMNWVDQNGGDSKTLKFVEMSASVSLAAIEEGRIDGADLNTPTLTRGLEGGKVRSLAQIFDAIAPRFANTGWFTTTDYATKNPTVVDKLRARHRRGERLLQRAPRRHGRAGRREREDRRRGGRAHGAHHVRRLPAAATTFSR